VATKKITITLPEDALAAVRRFAKEKGMPLSTWIAQQVEHEIRCLEGLAAMREWEAEHGAFTEEEIAEADAILAKADAETHARATAQTKPGTAA
jgi:cytosine/adenosine deaminase-related metal-dependent hydrolase